MERLKEVGLYGAELVPINGVLVSRYNQCLAMLGFEPTNLRSFSVDAMGWSPEIAEEKSTPYYLAHGEMNPYGIIVSPEQAGKPVYFPYHSFDREMLDYVYETYEEEITEITKDRAICLEIDQNLYAFSDPIDLLQYHSISIGFSILPNHARHKKEQVDLIEKFNHDDNYLDEELHKQILGSVRKHGVLTETVVELPTLEYKIDSFYTRTFGGVFVFRHDPTDTVVVVNDEKTFKELNKAASEKTFYIEDPKLLKHLAKRGWIEIDTVFCREQPDRFRRMSHMILAKTLVKNEIPDSIDEVLTNKALLRKYVNAYSDHEEVRLYHEVVIFMESIQHERQLPDISDKNLHYSLHHPARDLPKETRSLLWKLLGKVSRLDPFYLYKYDKDEFYRVYQTWSEPVKQWVTKTILENNS